MNINELKGKTIAKIDGASGGSDRIEFHCTDGTRYAMWHSQDCCESVMVEDVTGDIEDLIGSEVLEAEERTSDIQQDGKPSHPESFTWTFYHIATMKGRVDIRWLGESNGYYSEAVDFAKVSTE